MKLSFTTTFALLSSAACVLAQQTTFGAPTEGSTLVAGQPFTAEVDFTNSLTGSQQVAIVISIRPCSAFPCPSFDNEVLGTVLYNGKYNFTFHPKDNKFYHNFTLTAPSSLQDGHASLFLSHFYLLGAGPEPILDVNNITVSTKAAS